MAKIQISELSEKMSDKFLVDVTEMAQSVYGPDAKVSIIIQKIPPEKLIQAYGLTVKAPIDVIHHQHTMLLFPACSGQSQAHKTFIENLHID